jgi:Fe-S oxidoreductase
MTTKDKYKKVAYYPGCALEGTGHAYNRSTKAVGKKLGLDLVEVKDWNCCGAMEVKNIDPKIQTYLSSRVMSTAANEMDMDVVMAPCNGCYHNLKKAEYDLANDEESAIWRTTRNPSKSLIACQRKRGTRLTSPARSRPFTRSTGSRIRSVRKAWLSVSRIR